MSVVELKLSGMREYVGSEACRLHALRATAEGVFRSYGYTPVDMPIVDRASAFLDKSGEDIRRRMYVFADPSGREVCLRPDLTIPTCNLYLRNRAAFSREARLSYSGPAFRYDPPAEGRFRQFLQAGVELIGAGRALEADAEILAIALQTVRTAGVDDAVLVLGDRVIIDTFVEGLTISERAKFKLHRLIRTKNALQALLAAPEAESLVQATSSSALGQLLSALGSERARVLVGEVLALADVRHVGARTPEEIASRLIETAYEDEVSPISVEVLRGVIELLSIKGDPAIALQAVRLRAKDMGIAGLGSILDNMTRRLELLDAFGQSPRRTVVDIGLSRGLAYYTGFIFEVISERRADLNHLCGGGRYDSLLETLGAANPTPAVGCAIGLERLVIALEDTMVAPSGRHADAIVVGAGEVPDTLRISVATTLRKHGWDVEADASGRRPKNVLQDALKRSIPFVVFVGEDETKNASVRVRCLADRREDVVPIAELGSYVRQQERRPRSHST